MKAIVTGHSRGLGAAIAATLLSRGIPVMGISRAPNAELGMRYPAMLRQQQLDLADTASVATWLADDTLADFLADCSHALLVNNAGTVQPVGPLAMNESAAIAKAIALNVATPLMLASAVAACRDKRETRILHISSGAGRSAIPGWSAYCATKAALDHHARTVAQEGTPTLRICSMAPGVIDTDMQAEIRDCPAERFPLREQFQMLKKSGGLSTAEDCALHLMDFLLSDAFGRLPVADLRDLAG